MSLTDYYKDKFEESLNYIRTIYEDELKRNEGLIEENEILKNEHYKDSELQKMKAELKEMSKDYYRGFPISEDEDEEIKRWQKEHIDKKHNGNRYAGAIGGRFTYCFIPTSIGVIGTVKCSCGEEFTFQEMM